MNDLDKLVEALIKEKGGTMADYKRLMDSIVYQETGGTSDPSTKQLGRIKGTYGPGRGAYQLEIGDAKGGETAANRLYAYMKDTGLAVPTWLKNIKGKSVDASTLTREQQDMLFLGNMRKHPTADFKKVWDGEQTIKNFWLENHWAGADKDKAARSRSFDNSMLARDKKILAKDPYKKTRDSILKANKDIPFIKRVLNPSLNDGKSIHIDGTPEGSLSTHYTESAEADGYSYVYPTVKDVGGDKLKYLGDSAFSDAIKNKNYIRFKDPKKAREFGENYKTQEFKDYKPTSKINKLDFIKNNKLPKSAPFSLNPNEFSKGGNIGSNSEDSFNRFNAGGLHAQNPLGGIPQGIGQNGKPNTVEEGETSFKIKGNKYIFSNRIGTDGSNVPNKVGNQFSGGGNLKKKDNTKVAPKLPVALKEKYNVPVEERSNINNGYINMSNDISDTEIKDTKKWIKSYLNSKKYKDRFVESSVFNQSIWKDKKGGYSSDIYDNLRKRDLEGASNHYNEAKEFINNKIDSVEVEKVDSRTQSFFDNLKRVIKGKEEITAGSRYNRKNNKIQIDSKQTIEDEGEDNYSSNEGITAHEYGHIFPTLNKNRKDILNILINKRNLSDHDALPSETKSDIYSIRYLMNKYNINNAGKEDFSKENLKDIKKKLKQDGSMKRLLRLYNDEELIYLMNTVADNNKKPNTNIV